MPRLIQKATTETLYTIELTQSELNTLEASLYVAKTRGSIGNRPKYEKMDEWIQALSKGC